LIQQFQTDANRQLRVAFMVSHTVSDTLGCVHVLKYNKHIHFGIEPHRLDSLKTSSTK